MNLTDDEFERDMEQNIIVRSYSTISRATPTVLEWHTVTRATEKYLPYLHSMLNPAERELFSQDCIKGTRALWCAKRALETAKELYSSGLHNGNGDAFRHAYWNALMKDSIGGDWAKKWGDAHETAPGPELEKQMDLFNNELGRTLSPSSDAVRDAIRSGKGRRLVGNALVPTNNAGEA